MAAARKRPAVRRPRPKKCTGYAGSGWGTETHMVGRGKKVRPAGEVEVLCPTCLGTGHQPGRTGHINCANCPRCALAWRTRITAAPRPAPAYEQPALF